MVWDEVGYLGCVWLYREGETVPVTLHVMSGDRNRYREANGNGIVLRPRDRKHGRLVMEDDTEQRQQALRLALEADGWVHVQERG